MIEELQKYLFTPEEWLSCDRYSRPIQRVSLGAEEVPFEEGPLFAVRTWPGDIEMLPVYCDGTTISILTKILNDLSPLERELRRLK